MRAVHVFQDDSGLWAVTGEHDDGRLELIAHAGTRDDMVQDAERVARRQGAGGVVVEEPHRAFPEGGLAPGYVPPGPRRAVT